VRLSTTGDLKRPHGRHQLLIVDDEPDLRWVLRGLFEDEGFVVDEAGRRRRSAA
jgi:CheY-like chemotaxis protein